MIVAAALLVAVSASPAPIPTEEALRRVVADYVGLYRRDSLDRWRTLFLPTFTAAHTGKDGGVTVRTLDEFFAAQKRYFNTGRAIKEELENLRIERHGTLASAWADFVLTDEGEKSRGKLVLSLIADRGQWKIQSLMFSYDSE